MTFVPWKGDADLSNADESCVGLWTTGVSPVSCNRRGSYLCEVPMSKSLQKSHSEAGRKSATFTTIFIIPQDFNFLTVNRCEEVVK